MTFNIIISPEAQVDIKNFYRHICNEYKQPLTALRNRTGLYNKIKELARHADIFAANEYVQSKFGNNARHIIFKKMAIVYLVEDNLAYIVRIIPASLIWLILFLRCYSSKQYPLTGRSSFATQWQDMNNRMQA